MVPAKLHGNRLRIDVWIDVERNNFYKYSIKFHTDLINNFLSTKSNSAKLTGKLPQYQPMVPAKLHGKRLRIDVWIHVEMNNFYKYSIKFHTDLINNFWSTKSNFAKFTGKLP